MISYNAGYYGALKLVVEVVLSTLKIAESEEPPARLPAVVEVVRTSRSIPTAPSPAQEVSLTVLAFWGL